MSDIPHIPILRAGKVHRSLDEQAITNVAGTEDAVRLSFACADMIKHDLIHIAKAREALQAMSCKELVQICLKAADLFLEATLPVGCEGHQQSPEDYVQQLAKTSGLPHSLIRMNMKRLHGVLSQTDVILKGLTRSLDLDILDRGYGDQDGAPVSFAAMTDCLGVILPSNSPAVNALWVPSIAMKIPVVLKPGREEPWTPYRIIEAMKMAGAPAEAFSFYPTQHDGSGAIIRRAGRVMLFGGDDTVKQYEHDPRVEVHGTGYSKLLIGEDQIEQWPDYVDTIVESVSANSGRSCINVSTIVVPKYGDEIARAVAEKLLAIQPLAQNDPNAKLSGFANPKFAEWINDAVNSGLKDGAKDMSAELRPESDRFQQLDGMNYLLPTIVRAPSWEHDLAVREFLFPYASVIECPQEEVIPHLGKSLVVTAITKDLNWINQLFAHPTIDRLNIGNVPTNHLKWDQPHEGNLFEFLYARRSFQIENVA
ncbi:MAG: aldehyde dehydrogenase family protein [Verrucomicrobiota bacterium]